MLGADLLLMLTDTAGVFTADPRRDQAASLIEEIVEIDAALERSSAAPGTERGSGGMASKLAAAKIAAWSGVRTVIASAALPGVVDDAVAGPSRRHVVRAAARAAAEPQALDRVRTRVGGEDRGRRGRAPRTGRRGQVVAPAGVREVEGGFDVDATVEIVDEQGVVFAKGLCRYTSESLRTYRGQRTTELPEGFPHEVVHRDDLVVLP